MFKNIAIFDFESICVPSEELKPTETITWIEKHEPISMSNLSSLLDQSIFCVTTINTKSLVVEFVAKLEVLVEKNKTEMRSNFWKLKTISKTDFTQFSASKRVSKKVKPENAKAKVSRMRKKNRCINLPSQDSKNQLIDLIYNLERYTNTLPLFGFNTCRYDINFTKSYRLPYLINEKEIEFSNIKKANDFTSFTFGDNQLFGHYEVFVWSYFFRIFSKSLLDQRDERL